MEGHWSFVAKRIDMYGRVVGKVSRAPVCGLRWSSRSVGRFVEEPRVNPVGIQYLSQSLHRQVFGDKVNNVKHQEQGDREALIELAKMSLNSHGLLNKKTAISEPISFELPKLQGQSLDEHFQKIGNFVGKPYMQLCADRLGDAVPALPSQWLLQSGWTKYIPGKVPVQVDFPTDDTLVFDVETMYKVSHYPTLATAVGKYAWYCWCSPYITDGNTDYKHLIPLNTPNKPKLVIGHNVSYDRGRVLEEYNLKDSKSFYMDTQSLHVASSGLCSGQRPAFLKKKKSEDESNSSSENPWLDVSSMNSLRDVAKLHCNIKMDKEPRKFFEATDKNIIIDNFQLLVNYCANDVIVTSKVFDKVYPLFRERCPHPISFSALKSLNSCILPTRNENWQNYLTASESIYQDSKQKIEENIVNIIDEIVSLKDTPELVENNPWLKQLDWTIRPVKYAKKSGLPSIKKLPGYPEWYRSLFSSQKETKPTITIKSRIVPILFKLSWENYPVIWTKSNGWCFPVEKDKMDLFKTKNYHLATEDAYSDSDIKDSVLFRIPHPNGPGSNSTNLLAKGYVHFFEKGVMTSQSKYAHEALKINASGSYWMSSRERIMNQFVVPTKDEKTKDLGIILPGIIPMGTITRRAVENTWLTASNAKLNRIGSELKTKVISPEGYCFVGADVDSEELWIASLVGDSVFNIHGGTAIGWMCLEGTKNDGTDLHTKTAKILGCTRNEAKIFNYGRIYGAGARFAAQLLKNFNPSLSDKDAKESANQLYENTKGMSRHSKFFKKFWFGGSESILFNKLESIADEDQPRTPVLGCSITSSLLKKNLGTSSFLPSRINWAIQSSGVDYLHLLFCSMDYLIAKYNIDARLCISIHDEIRYLVANKDKYRAAMALQVSNIWTRAIFCEQMGIADLPQNCAFFSAVDIDRVLRKEVDMDCITPSNSTPIPHGERLDINQLLLIPESKLLNPSQEIDISNFTFEKRESVFSQYNRAYDKDFLKYFLKMQVLDTKWKVAAVESEYIKIKREKEFANLDGGTEYGYLDYIKDVTKGKRSKSNIMDVLPPVHKDPKPNTEVDRPPSLTLNSLHEIAKSTPIGIEVGEIKTSPTSPSITKIQRKQKWTTVGRIYKKVYGGKKAYDAFHECVGQSKDFANDKENHFFSISATDIVNDVLQEPIDATNQQPTRKSRLSLGAQLPKPNINKISNATKTSEHTFTSSANSTISKQTTKLH